MALWGFEFWVRWPTSLGRATWGADFLGYGGGSGSENETQPSALARSVHDLVRASDLSSEACCCNAADLAFETAGLRCACAGFGPCAVHGTRLAPQGLGWAGHGGRTRS